MRSLIRVLNIRGAEAQLAQPNMGTPPVDLKLKEGLPPKPETMLRLFCEKFFKNKLAVAGSAILLVIIFRLFSPR